MRRRPSFREYLVEKAPLQIIAVALALVAWIFVNSGRTVEIKRSVKIQYVQIPSGLVFQRTPLKELKVTLAGSIYRLRTIRDEDLTYLVDLSHMRAGPTKVEFEPDALRLPLDVEVNSVNPRIFNVHLEETSVQTLPVQLIVEGKPKAGHMVTYTRLNRESVGVSGPKSVVSKLGSVELKISVEGKDAGFHEKALPKANISDTEVLDEVIVEVGIDVQKVKKEFRDVPVVVEGRAGKIRVTPATARIIIEAIDTRPGAAQSDKKWDPKVVVPAEGLRKGRYRIRGKVELPEGFRLSLMEPKDFLVEVAE